MGSASVLNVTESQVSNPHSDMEKQSNIRSKSANSETNDAGSKTKTTVKLKRNRQEVSEGTRKMPKRAAACSNFKEKSVSLPQKSSVESKREVLVEDEIAALGLTAGREVDRPNRRLTEFVFHDEDGNPQAVEMLEVGDLYISGVVLPLEESSDKEKEMGVRCEGFGRIEDWSISGYEDGLPVTWVSTDIAYYNCIKPANGYRKLYNLFFEKARACVEIYKKLSRASRGDPELSLDELLAGVLRSMSDSKNFPHGTSIKDFLISQGEFIYNQLVGLDESSKKNDLIFTDLPVLVALRDENKKHMNFVHLNATSSVELPHKRLKIGDVELNGQPGLPANDGDRDEDAKLAMLLQEEENWRAMKQRNGRRPVVSSTNRYYIKINEDEIAGDYPLPVYYKTTKQETDEYIIFGNEDAWDSDELPRSMLHNWALYNSDSRLISLELLPMRSCADIDVTIFGSGIMTGDDGTGFDLDAVHSKSSSSSAGTQDIDGIPIYLSAIKEWMIEFGSSMVFISIRTDMG